MGGTSLVLFLGRLFLYENCTKKLYKKNKMKKLAATMGKVGEVVSLIPNPRHSEWVWPAAVVVGGSLIPPGGHGKKQRES